jgi:5-methylcytosine-specific restriction protein A
MAVTHGHGNPDWTRDETILALCLYFDSEGTIPPSSDERVIELSRLLRSLPYHSLASRRESFRNPDGVAFKLQNIRHVATGKGLGRVSHMDRAIWAEFADKRDEVRRLRELIKTGIMVYEALGEDGGDEFQFPEGRMVTEAHNRRERNPRLRRKLIENRRCAGPLKCELCECIETDVAFSDAIFEAHHLIPLSEGGERTTRIKDLALLCANCHRRLHCAITEHSRWLTIPEARELIYSGGVCHHPEFKRQPP